RQPPSFPTRRSSDLIVVQRRAPLLVVVGQERLTRRPHTTRKRATQRRGHFSALRRFAYQAPPHFRRRSGSSESLSISAEGTAIRSEEHTSELQSRGH